MVKPEVQPSFPGGDVKFMAWLCSETVFPAEAEKKKVEGRVIASFIVEKDGSLSNIVIVSSPDELFSQEVMRLLKTSPKWIPGKENGVPVRSSMTIPISFRLTK